MGFFSSRKKRSSKDAAKDRLQVLLAIDRGKNNDKRVNAIIEQMQQEILAVISKYVTIDESVNISFQSVGNSNEDSSTELIANIPIKGFKRIEKRPIKAIISILDIILYFNHSPQYFGGFFILLKNLS